MAEVSREQLEGYLDDALSEAETSKVENALRGSEKLRKQLRSMMVEIDRGDHSLGAVWRRNRLSCPSREQLGSYLLGALDTEQQSYIDFHLQMIGCSYCCANLDDLKSLQQDGNETKKRRRRIFQSSAGLLRKHAD